MSESSKDAEIQLTKNVDGLHALEERSGNIHWNLFSVALNFAPCSSGRLSKTTTV